MDKWEDKIKKHVNQDPPEDITKTISKSLQQLPRKRSHYFKLYYTTTAAALAFLITIAVSFFSPAVADTMRSVPIIGSVFDTVGSIGVQRGNEQGLTTMLGEQVEMDGHLITFTESLYDGSEVHIGYIIESLDPTNEMSQSTFPSDIEMTINGRNVGSYGMGGRGELLDNGNYVGTINIRFRDEVPDKFLLGIQPRVGRSWKVELPVELQGENESFLVNETRETEDMTIHYDKVTFYPTATEIAFRQITDIPAINEEDPYMFMSYMVVDNEGRVLQPFGGGGGGSTKGEKLVESIKYNFEPLDQKPKSITITPYLNPVKTDKPSVVRGKWEEKELTLSQGEIGSLTILSVEEDDDSINVVYKVEGDNFYEQSISLLVEDSSGNRYESDNRPPSRVDGTINQYEAIFSTPLKLEDIYFITFEKDAPKFFHELEITVDLK
ncbi:DUF4179 domain-containing protein [Evansella sp. AB-P1]|uniref:DUF4179 domain-containing protein n=1 Tax=Evansella sp. AB-P1 TaxID=3037653 RepID=UPI00241F2096|nr:DUF4179 domain-containing protein [Evansella sp. AB-P1]MDG5788544.1 DUF4179 domain-containing protein [Evansella sp. AB-P1]